MPTNGSINMNEATLGTIRKFPSEFSHSLTTFLPSYEGTSGVYLVSNVAKGEMAHLAMLLARLAMPSSCALP